MVRQVVCCTNLLSIAYINEMKNIIYQTRLRLTGWSRFFWSGGGMSPLLRAFISFMVNFVDDLSLVLNVQVPGVDFVCLISFGKELLICIIRYRRIGL